MTSPDEATGTGARFIKLLQALAEGNAEFSLKDLAARLRLPPSTVHRLLKSMVASNLVEGGGAQGYRIGRELFRIASLVMDKVDVPEIARPLLQELWAEYQSTCSLALYIPATRTAMIVVSIPAAQGVRVGSQRFTHRDLVWGSVGRSILAFLSPEDIEAVITAAEPGPLSNLPPPPLARLRQDLERIRRQGYAIHEDRSYPDVGGVAAPFFDHTGKVLGCIAVLMPGDRLEATDKKALAERVSGQAHRLSSLLDFTGQPIPPPGRRS